MGCGFALPALLGRHHLGRITEAGSTEPSQDFDREMGALLAFGFVEDLAKFDDF